MNAVPRVSVCIPAYAAAAFLRSAVQSVLDQTYGDLEVIVVDDASTDGTLESISGLSDPRIRRYSNPSNLGGGANWNRAASLARGKWIKILCSDDLLRPRCLEEQVRILEDPRWADVGLVCGWRDVIDAGGKRILTRTTGGLRHHVAGRAALRAIVRSGTNPLGEPAAVLFRRELLEKTGPFDGSNPFMLDIDMWSRMLLSADLYAVPSVVCAFRVSGDSWSVQLARRQSHSYRRWIDRISRDPRYGLGTGELLLGRFKSAGLNLARLAFYMGFVSRISFGKGAKSGRR